jgi:hypothetical protein
MPAAEIIDAARRGAVSYEDALDALTVAPAAEADAALGTAVAAVTDRLVQGGWQPAELHRVIARLGNPVQAQLIGHTLKSYFARFQTIDPRWRAQAEELPSLAGTDRIRLLDAQLGLLIELRKLPRIETLIPPPGSKPAITHRGADNRILVRVRALLAKAESTDFPAEAEAYSAKAQELIARHSIEEVLTSGPEITPLARRIGVDHPYESEKATLVDAVARANHCHTVWSPEFAFVTIFGFDADIDAVELLYTSLLVQANRAMSRSEPTKGKARIKAFRRSFLVAYAVRIGERLDRATRHEIARHEIARHRDLLPVLRGRDLQVREAMTKAFPRTVKARGSRVDSLEGWQSGRAAADEANLA